MKEMIIDVLTFVVGIGFFEFMRQKANGEFDAKKFFKEDILFTFIVFLGIEMVYRGLTYVLGGKIVGWGTIIAFVACLVIGSILIWTRGGSKQKLDYIVMVGVAAVIAFFVFF